MTVQQQFSTIRSEISGQSIEELTAKFGTPAYVYEAQTIRDRIEQLRQFDVIRFAQKANSNMVLTKNPANPPPTIASHNNTSTRRAVSVRTNKHLQKWHWVCIDAFEHSDHRIGPQHHAGDKLPPLAHACYIQGIIICSATTRNHLPALVSERWQCW